LWVGQSAQRGNVMKKQLIALTFIIFLMPNSYAFDIPDFKYMVFLEGKCNSAMLNSIDVTNLCREKVVHTLWKTGNIGFRFFIENTLISFGGNNDAQPNKNIYVLQVNGIYLGKYKGNESLGVENINAKGTCRVEGDLSKKANITCTAVTEQNNVFEVNFFSNRVDKVFHGE
jgi:hypothetical protein